MEYDTHYEKVIMRVEAGGFEGITRDWLSIVMVIAVDMTHVDYVSVMVRVEGLEDERRLESM